MNDYYNDVKASLLVFCAGLVGELNPGVSSSLAVEYFDAARDPGKLPEKDLLGPFQTEMDDEGQLITVRTMILAGTLQDKNLFRLDAIIGKVYANLRPDMKIPFVDHETGVVKGQFTVMPGVSVLPLDFSTPRPMKSVAIELKADLPSA